MVPIEMQIQNTYADTGGSVVQVRTVLLTSDIGSSTRRGRHNYYYADHTIWPHKRAAHPVMFKFSVCRYPKNPTTSSVVKIELSTPNSMAGTQLSACMVQIQSTTAVFFKILKFSAHLFWPWHYQHSSLISCQGFIMKMVIVLSFAQERKTVPNGYTPGLITRTVQSPFKLNDKI